LNKQVVQIIGAQPPLALIETTLPEFGSPTSWTLRRIGQIIAFDRGYLYLTPRSGTRELWT